MRRPRSGAASAAPSDAEPEWLDARAAADRLGVKLETLYAYASRGRIESAPVAGSRARRYRREDLDRLKARRDARAGHGPVAAGALRWGEPVLETAVSRIDAEGHFYRGRSALELARSGASFEQVAELLWTGALPETAPRWASPGARLLQGAALARLVASAGAPAKPLDPLLVAAPALGAADPDRHGQPPGRAGALVRQLVAAFALPAGERMVKACLAAPSTAEALFCALSGHSAPDAKAGPKRIAAVDRALILCADHELNPSSFAARVAASAGADDYACLSAALATLSGPVHGGATERVEALVEQAGRPERGVAVIRERLARGEAVPGFGHPLYAEGDPRARVLLDDARSLGARRRGRRTVEALVEAMDLAGQPPPTVDTGLVALAAALGLPRGAALAIFAAGRMAGWLAHVAEQRQAGFVLRPRARYVEP